MEVEDGIVFYQIAFGACRCFLLLEFFIGGYQKFYAASILNKVDNVSTKWKLWMEWFLSDSEFGGKPLIFMIFNAFSSAILCFPFN